MRLEVIGAESTVVGLVQRGGVGCLLGPDPDSASGAVQGLRWAG